MVSTTTIKQGRAPARRPRNDLRAALLFILPAAIGFGVFYLVPAIRGIYFSFTQYNILGTPKWIGLANFEKIAVDPLFWNAMSVTIWYVILNIGFQTIIAIVCDERAHPRTQVLGALTIATIGTLDDLAGLLLKAVTA